MWPIEALPRALQFIGRLFPFAAPAVAFRSIMKKNSDFCEENVYMAFVTSSVWILVSLMLSLWCLRRSNKS